MMLKLPPSTAQSYTLLLQSVSIRQGLELICAETGLKYEITPDGVHVSLTDAAAAADAKTAPRTTPVAKISIPSADGTYSLDFFVRQDELPADILEVRSELLKEIIQKIRRDVAPQTPAPVAPNSPGR